jgi:hypothetical protein
MKRLEQFEEKKDHAIFSPVGPASFAEGVDLIRWAVRRCRKQKISKLLIDTRGLPEFRPPGMTQQFELAELIAADAQSLVMIAHVASHDWIRFGTFGLIVAKNRGLNVMNFRSETEALKWLLTPATPPANNSSSRAFESGGISRAEV